MDASVQLLVEQIWARAKDDTFGAIPRERLKVAEQFAARGISGGQMRHAIASLYPAAAEELFRRVISEIPSTVSEFYQGHLPDSVAVELADFLVSRVDGIITSTVHAVESADKDMHPLVTQFGELALRLKRDIAIAFAGPVARERKRQLTNTEDRVLTEERDLFLSHASADKAAFADALYNELTSRNLRVWYDSQEITLGDTLLGQIDKGLAKSRFGVVVISPAYVTRKWTRLEMDAFAAKSMREGRKVILPVLHGITPEELAEFSPSVAGMLWVDSRVGVAKVADAIQAAMA